MKKLITLSVLLFSISLSAYCTTWTVTNAGETFTPATITIILGDDVNFDLQSAHNAREVSQSTWNANGNTPLPGGFETPFGGGLVSSSKLTVGTHWYVCAPHASNGMKGMIIVQAATATNDNQAQINLSAYPNPFSNVLIIEVNKIGLDCQYILSDQLGRQVQHGVLFHDYSVLDMSFLKPGIYLFRITGNKSQSMKLIKS